MSESVPVHWIGYVVLLLSIIAYTNTTIRLVNSSENLDDPVITRLRKMWRNVKSGSAACAIVTGALLATSGHGSGGTRIALIAVIGGLLWKQFCVKIETYHPKGFNDDLQSWTSSSFRFRRTNDK